MKHNFNFQLLNEYKFLHPEGGDFKEVFTNIFMNRILNFIEDPKSGYAFYLDHIDKSYSSNNIILFNITNS